MTQNNLEAADVLQRADELDFPSSVVEFMEGKLGQPYGGFPEPLRTKVRELISEFRVHQDKTGVISPT